MSKLFSKPKALLGIALVLCMIISMLPVGVLSVSAAGAWDGEEKVQYSAENPDAEPGTADNPFLIETGAQLAQMAADVNAGTNKNAHFKLIANIDLGGKSWTPIGDTRDNPFTGTFDGNGHTITNLYINSSACGIGLFGYNGAGAVIKNLSLKGDVTLTGTNVVAGLLGFVLGDVTISNCAFTGTVTGDSRGSENAFVGGLLGYVSGAHRVVIENCAVNATITSNGTVRQQGTGGFIGAMIGGSNVTITDSSFSGEINGAYGTGGLIGNVANTNTSNLTKVTIERSYSEGTVTFHSGASKDNNTFLGGLVGQLRNQSGDNPRPIQLIIEDSYSVATIDQTVNGSGLVGSNFAYSDSPADCSVEIKNSFFAGSAKYPIVNRGNTTAGLMNVTTENVYYQIGSASEASDLTPADTCEKSATAFADGTVVALLNGDRNVWLQGGAYPVLELEEAPLAELTVGGVEVDLTKHPFSYDAQTVKSTDDGSITVAATPAKEGANVLISAVDEAGKTATVEDGTVTLAEGRTTTITIAAFYNATITNYTVTVYREPTPWDGTYEPFENYSADTATSMTVYEIANAAQFYFFAKLVNEGTIGTPSGAYVPVNLGSETYTISKAASHKGLFNGSTVKLTADIDLNGRSFNPIGTAGKKLGVSIFDGDNHEIKNLNISSSDANTGLFGYVSYNVNIQNLTVRGSVTCTANNPVGGIVGRMEYGGSMTNCAFIGNVSGANVLVGGLVGWCSAVDNSSSAFVKCTFTDCYTDGTLTASGRSSSTLNGVGGLVGAGPDYNAAADDGGDTMEGGIVIFTNCYSTMNIQAPSNASEAMKTGQGVGGLLGQFRDNDKVTYATFDNCYFAGSVCSPYPITTKLVGPRKGASSTVNKVRITNDVYYKADSYKNKAAGAGIDTGFCEGMAHEYNAGDFADGTVTALLGEGWATSIAGHPVHSDIVLPTNALIMVGTDARTNAPGGLRFHFGVNTAARINGLKEYGVVVGKAANFTNGLLLNTNGEAKELSAKAKAFDGETYKHVREGVEENDMTYDQFTVRIDFNSGSTKNYQTKYNAKAYALYEDSKGQTLVVYSPVIDGTDASHPNTLYDVAVKAKKWNDELVAANPDDPRQFNADELAYLNGIIDTVKKN